MIVAFILFCSSMAQADFGTVILLRGSAKNQIGESLSLKSQVQEGTSVSTGAQSFVKILFKDNSQISIGPETTMKLANQSSDGATMVDLVSGQIRAKVTKDVLQSNSVKEKLLIRTKTAAIGVRGTDFNVTYNLQNDVTSVVTFEGSVVMAKVIQGQIPSTASEMFKGKSLQSIGPGQYSMSKPDLVNPTIPVKISPAQLESLRANDTYQGVGDKNVKKDTALASPIPPGVDAKTFGSASDKAIEQSMAKSIGDRAIQDLGKQAETKTSESKAPAEGFFDAKTGSYAPRAGGFVDLNSGVYVPPPAGSSFDPNTGVYVPPRAAGKIDPVTGNYIPPKGVDFDPVKGFVPEAKPISTPVNQTGGPQPASLNNPSSAQAPPPAANQALATALNGSMSPNQAGTSVSFDKTFTPTAPSNNNQGFVPPPPPPQQVAPPPAAIAPPRTPVNDPYCPTCHGDSVPQSPANTNVQFKITVQ